MKNRYMDEDTEQSAYLLDYDRRRILSCADTFRSLASVFMEMNREEQEEEGTGCEDRERLWRMQKAKEERRQYAAYMRQMSGLLQRMVQTSVQLIRLGGRQERQIIRALAAEGILVQDIYLLRGEEGRLEITVSLCTRKDISITAEEIADYLSVLMDIRLVPEKRNPYFVGREPVSLYFEEEPAYCCMTASATAVRENETVSGDSHSFFEEDGKISLILSDGVGSGEQAGADSTRIVDLTEQILDAGLGPRMAAQLLNGMAGVQEEETHMATLDICRIDLRNGECALVKAGAACTFIKRGSQVEKISSGKLPLGMTETDSYPEAVRQLQNGDMVILVSDGVLQDWPCGEGEFRMARQIEKLQVSSPVDMANLLLRYALEQCRGKVLDDMTILAAGIWKNERNQNKR